MKPSIGIVVTMLAAAAIAPAMSAEKPADQLEVLQEPEIRVIVIGREWVPSPDVRQVAFDFVERFVADGTWQSWRAERALVQLEGVWTIENDKLCVKLTKGRSGDPKVGDTRCRAVRRTVGSDRIAMTDLDAPIDGADQLVVFSERPFFPSDGFRRR
ncbi:hypothetical protein [Sphingopyxis sp.]|uniref:hypothetical protein n=1 Tax=Sphingopyxis sp. TaxID=1908224 RepID=UPI003D6D2ABF